MLPDTAIRRDAIPRVAIPGSDAWPAALARMGATIRHNTILLLREPGPLASRLIMPVVFLALLHPLYQAAQGVQASAFPTAYAQWEAQAAQLVQSISMQLAQAPAAT